ncbi:YheC/YheD family protein [Alicyclobacillus fodiniaquatilis]|uniref:YheC/YheD family protein n=1 Tax=Alicyclobacillus fodiniaquatilis TaxID=1661150 RepID=A0ABW4JE73_9BACL
MFFVLTGSDPRALRHLRRRQKTFEWLANACSTLDLEMVLTTPERIDARGFCRGWSLDKKRPHIWRSRHCKMAGGVVYDAMYLSELKTHRGAYRKALATLRRLGIIFFNPKLPAKDELHQWLLLEYEQRKATADKKLLPSTQFDIDANVVLRRLNETQSPMWFKPVYGSGGRNMLRIEPLTNKRFAVRGERFYDRDIKAEWSEDELCRRLDRALTQRVYLLQEDIGLLQTQDGRKVDFRVTVARGSQGIWGVTALTARFGRVGHALTNFHAGGSIQSLTLQNAQATRETIAALQLQEADISHVADQALEVAKLVSLKYPHVGILGIDVGISAADKAAYVYDCNSRPGRDILTNHEVEVTMQQVARFARYLLNTAPSL